MSDWLEVMIDMAVKLFIALATLVAVYFGVSAMVSDFTKAAEKPRQAYTVTLCNPDGETIEEWHGIENVTWDGREPKGFKVDGKWTWVRGGILIVKEE